MPKLTDERLRELEREMWNRACFTPVLSHSHQLWMDAREAIRELQRLRKPCEECRTNPTRKVGEELVPMFGIEARHNRTAYLCEACFRRLFGDAKVTEADEYDARG